MEDSSTTNNSTIEKVSFDYVFHDLFGLNPNSIVENAMIQEGFVNPIDIACIQDHHIEELEAKMKSPNKVNVLRRQKVPIYEKSLLTYFKAFLHHKYEEKGDILSNEDIMKITKTEWRKFRMTKLKDKRNSKSRYVLNANSINGKKFPTNIKEIIITEGVVKLSGEAGDSDSENSENEDLEDYMDNNRNKDEDSASKEKGLFEDDESTDCSEDTSIKSKDKVTYRVNAAVTNVNYVDLTGHGIGPACDSISGESFKGSEGNDVAMLTQASLHMKERTAEDSVTDRGSNSMMDKYYKEIETGTSNGEDEYFVPEFITVNPFAKAVNDISLWEEAANYEMSNITAKKTIINTKVSDIKKSGENLSKNITKNSNKIDSLLKKAAEMNELSKSYADAGFKKGIVEIGEDYIIKNSPYGFFRLSNPYNTEDMENQDTDEEAIEDDTLDSQEPVIKKRGDYKYADL